MATLTTLHVYACLAILHGYAYHLTWLHLPPKMATLTSDMSEMTRVAKAAVSLIS